MKCLSFPGCLGARHSFEPNIWAPFLSYYDPGFSLHTGTSISSEEDSNDRRNLWTKKGGPTSGWDEGLKPLCYLPARSLLQIQLAHTWPLSQDDFDGNFTPSYQNLPLTRRLRQASNQISGFFLHMHPKRSCSVHRLHSFSFTFDILKHKPLPTEALNFFLSWRWSISHFCGRIWHLFFLLSYLNLVLINP